MDLNRSYALLENHPAIVLFEELLQVSSISGHEERLATLIRARLSDMDYEAETDAAGNVLVRVAGAQPVAPLVCYAAHMDEIGMIVTSINDDGSLNVSRSGGLYAWKLGEGPVDIMGDSVTLTGILSMGSTHSASAGQEAIEWTDVRVITGLSCNQLQDAGIRAGTPVAPIQSVRGPNIFGDPGDPLVAAWTFDDRMGCVALLRFLEALKRDELQPQCPTIVAFTVGEEVGGLGGQITGAARATGRLHLHRRRADSGRSATGVGWTARHLGQGSPGHLRPTDTALPAQRSKNCRDRAADRRLRQCGQRCQPGALCRSGAACGLLRPCARE